MSQDNEEDLDGLKINKNSPFFTSSKKNENGVKKIKESAQESKEVSKTTKHYWKIDNLQNIDKTSANDNELVGAFTFKPVLVKSDHLPEVTNDNNNDHDRAKDTKDKVEKKPLDAIAKMLLAQMGYKKEDIAKIEAMESTARDEEIARIFEKLQSALKQEKGAVTKSTGHNGSGQNGEKNNATVASELLAAGGALVGGVASLALGGSAKILGAAVKSLGMGSSTETMGFFGSGTAKAHQFDAVAVLPKISEYRVKKTEEAEQKYSMAVETFWKVPPMALLRREIEERARKSGLSVVDVMEKMKPDGELKDLHDKFIKEVAASPEATQSKVFMDKALSSWIRQYDRASEEMLSADIDENPGHKKAKDRLDASKNNMELKTAESPVFGGESESHAERFRAAIEAILKSIRELFQAVRNKVSGEEVSHAS